MTDTVEQVRAELDAEREQLAGAVERFRREVGTATDVGTRIGGRLRTLVPAAFASAFVLAGGVGATMRLLARKSRERR